MYGIKKNANYLQRPPYLISSFIASDYHLVMHTRLLLLLLLVATYDTAQ